MGRHCLLMRYANEDGHRGPEGYHKVVPAVAADAKEGVW